MTQNSEATNPTPQTMEASVESAPAVDAPTGGAPEPSTSAPPPVEASPASGDAAPSLLEAVDESRLSAPETYEPFKLPDGVPFKADQLGALSDVARELNLSQAQAQRVVDSLGDMHQEFTHSITEKYRVIWAQEAQNDPEIGGAHFKENLSLAKRAYTQYASPALQKELQRSGLNNHPEIVRMFVRIGRSMVQDKGVRGEASSPRGPIRRFPNSNMVVEED